MNDLLTLLRYEIIIACSVALALNILWIPVIDFITHNKYGAVNKETILILSFCMPFLYFINFFWTINFAQGHLKRIFYISCACFLLNLISTVALIPFFNGEGAAFAYLISMIAQSVLFFKYSGVNKYNEIIAGMLLPILCAITGGIVGHLLFSNPWLELSTSFAVYLSGLLLTGQVRLSHWHLFKRISGF